MPLHISCIIIFVLISLFLAIQINIFAATGKFTLDLKIILGAIKRNILILLSTLVFAKLIPLKLPFTIKSTQL